MGRAAKFSADQVLDEARAQLIAHGPAGLTVQGVAAALSAPSGSVYYRFASRDMLTASLWLRSVERFQAGLFTLLDDPDGHAVAHRAAGHVLTWSRASLDDARVLMLYRGRDLVTAAWPSALQDRNTEQLARVDAFLTELGRRLGGTDPAAMRRIRFAVVDIPYAAVREALLGGEPPAPELDALVESAVTALLTPFTHRGEPPCP